MILFSRGTISGCVAAATLGILAATTATPASAQWRDRGGDWGAPVAAGIVGGLALGAIAAGAAQGPGYAPAPVYVPAPACWFERQPIFDPYGNIVRYRRIRVCR